jgi:SAM-dependent methyltransferase
VGEREPAVEDLVTATAPAPVSTAPVCRLCDAPLRHTFADLGATPLANAYVPPEALGQGEVFYPLHAYVCGECFLVQLPVFVRPEAIFSDYAYFSSVSDSWVEHARAYAEDAVARHALGRDSLVVELASNDGYLLRHFVDRGVPVLGVEPAANVAETAVAAGIPTLVEFFGRSVGERLAAEGRQADLVVGNNVLAHVPDVHDFVGGVSALLRPGGTVTMEFPHLLRLIEQHQFDTIYHEHFSYLSLVAVMRLFGEHGLELVDVDELPTHGGSIRIHARHRGEVAPGPAVAALLEEERAAGLLRLETYATFGARVRATKQALLRFLLDVAERGETVVAYGAAAKGNTLLNACGVRDDLIAYVVDRSPHKQGLYLPGSRLPIRPPDALRETRPDYLLLLAWNLADEIVGQMEFVREWGCRFVVPIPTVRVLGT